VVDRILAGKAMSAADLLAIQQARRRLIVSLSARLGDALMIFPAIAQTAPEIGPLEADDGAFHAMNLRVLRNTILGSFLDTPGVALPNGTDRNGLPTSLLVSAGSGRDDDLLGCALAIESCLSPG
jgi:aspartyl-tRNA(Asn)/glutamyl-tRNA(Gln) amidotransferase subunit A